MQNIFLFISQNISEQIKNGSKKLTHKKELLTSMNVIALILVIIGAINWGSIGLFGIDIVASLFGGQLSLMSRIIFTLVGIAGLWSITFFFKDSPIIDNNPD